MAKVTGKKAIKLLTIGSSGTMEVVPGDQLGDLWQEIASLRVAIDLLMQGDPEAAVAVLTKKMRIGEPWPEPEANQVWRFPVVFDEQGRVTGTEDRALKRVSRQAIEPDSELKAQWVYIEGMSPCRWPPPWEAELVQGPRAPWRLSEEKP
jgi:hypothetical protein